MKILLFLILFIVILLILRENEIKEAERIFGNEGKYEVFNISSKEIDLIGYYSGDMQTGVAATSDLYGKFKTDFDAGTSNVCIGTPLNFEVGTENVSRYLKN